MTYIPGISQGYTAAAAADRQKGDDKGDKLGLDNFLTLLVAQLKNQDPLNPTDATKFTSQLTQYSQLEQSINMNKNMKELLDIQKSSDRLSALSLIDKQVLVQGPSFRLEEGGARIGYQVNGDVSDLTITIRNQGGSTVATLHPSDLGPGNHTITWDGLDRNGQPLPAGTYEISATAPGSGDDSKSTVVPLVYADVTGVDMSGSEALLLTRNGDFKLSAVQGVYEQKKRQPSEPGEGEEQSPDAPVSDTTVSTATDGEGRTAASAGSGAQQDLAATEITGGQAAQ